MARGRRVGAERYRKTRRDGSKYTKPPAAARKRRSRRKGRRG